jgi:peptide-methionine (R)-S-oxide reductase
VSLFSAKTKAAETYPFTLSDAEWRERLTPEQYKIMRGHGTERACTSPLNAEKRAGVYQCAGCGQALFDTAAKFESGTGWPSFYQPVSPEAVAKSEDRAYGMLRTEVHCSSCGSHLGHVFPDGPPPTFLRYCMNGVALDFQATA